MLKNKSYLLNNVSQIILAGAAILFLYFGFFLKNESGYSLGKMTSVLMIPIFLFYSIIKGAKFNVLHKLIILVFFLSSFFAIFRDHFTCNILCTALLFLGISGLLSMAIKNLKTFNFKSGLGFCLLLVFLINVSFIVVLFNALKFNMTGPLEVVFFVIKFILLLVMAFVSFASYIEEGRKESLLFLFIAFCFLFSQAMYYLNTYYLPEFSFSFMAKILNIIGLFFIFQYIIEAKKIEHHQDKK